MPIVETFDLSKIYNPGGMQVYALDRVSISIDKGEFTALAGPSGSGKTTLLNLIGGLDRPDSGKIKVDGRELESLSDSDMADLRLKRIGFVFQSHNLIPVLTAFENVEYILRLQGVHAKERKERVRAILDEVGLSDKLDRRPAELSGGQQQRVAVARAIVSNPAIVLADEPTASLDSKTGEHLLELMLEMNREKKATFIFSTHDPMVMRYAGRVINLHDGRVCQ